MTTEQTIMLERANRLSNGDSIQRIIAGNLYESLRKVCREFPETSKELHDSLPRGYRLIPH